MKTIRNNITAEVKRVSEEMATSRVSTGRWSFCPKGDWKALRTDTEDVKVPTLDQQLKISRRADKKKDRNAKRNYKAK